MTILIHGRRFELRYAQNAYLVPRLQETAAHPTQPATPARELPAKVARQSIVRARLT